MDLHGLEQFLAVARREHLSRAADDLRVAQPSLSRTIARLESELGAPLFDRAGRLRLNDAGQIFRDHVERALGELEAARRAVADMTREGVGSVRLASESLVTLAGPLSAFNRQHPSADVELRQLPAADMHRALQAREVDLCVASQPVPGNGLESIRLHDEPVWLITPPDHRLSGRSSVTIKELRDEPFVTTRPGYWHRRLLDQLFAADNLTPRVVCEGDEAAATLELVAAGVGLTLIPDMARRVRTRVDISWVGIEDPACRRSITLHRATDARLSTAAELMRTTIANWSWTS